MEICVGVGPSRRSAELSDKAKPGWAVTFKLSTLEASTPAMETKKLKQTGNIQKCLPSPFYYALPVVDASGKNTLKLVPVEAVNIHKLLKPQQMNTVTNSLTSQQTFTKLLSCVNALPKEVRTPPTNCQNLLKNSCHLQVTVKSPALPKGQCLQIPPNAKVQTLPASKLPVTIKNQLFNPSANICPEPGEHKVVCVSPVTTVNKDVPSLHDSKHHAFKMAAKTPVANVSKSFLKLVPKAPDRPHGPVQWVIEEGNEMALSQNHLNSSVISQIVHTVKERERAAQQQSGITNRDALCPDKGKPDQDNALVMCNGKVFFVGKKSSVQKSTETSVKQTQTPPKIIIPAKCDEVIDLCNDEAQDTSPQPAAGSVATVSHQEDDCVIFVSYIPPKAEDKSKHNLCNSGTSHMDTATRAESTGGVDPAGKFSHCGMDKGLPNCKTGSKRPHSMVETNENDPGVCDSTVITITKDVTVKSQERSSDKHGRKSSVDSRATFSNQEDMCEEHATADRHLMQVFGITAEVKVRLQRIDNALASAVPPVPLKNGSVSLRKNHKVLYDSCKNQEENRCRSVTRLTQDGHAADGIPFQYAVFNLNSSRRSDSAEKCHSGAHTGQMLDVESAAAINYLEPIDEDFIDADAALGKTKNTNTRRMGRTRKRTMCRCCVPGAEMPDVKIQMKK